ncbi:MAG: PH domain-containing protein [Pedosphaera sp.]|nr:PH domain-containing protein [Pedosphaera sp.]
MTHEPPSDVVLRLERPHPSLLTYYILTGILTGPGLLVALPYLYFRYHTLRYRFDEEGIHMKVGILFRREVNLTYARIQDIHLRSNLIQRWLGLATVQIQTASGSSEAELVVEGFKEFDVIRDFLYARMRGCQPQRNVPTAGPGTASERMGGEDLATILSLLANIRDDLRATRQHLEIPPASRAAVATSSSDPHV